ncbi:hypothetical protein [Brevibacillus sp. IT-7CA2]|uniref:hypothetical protein n=1 Tax=Brevibacillus sp. IT-7CA2 TaxID=3026436 RepID=UPI0039E0427F
MSEVIWKERKEKKSKKQKLELIMTDFKLFAKNFIKIIDNNGDLVSFVLNKEQSEYIESKKNLISY